MDKYLSIFKISLKQEFSYRLNFIMWRVRNVIQIFIIFSLWDVLLVNNSSEILGYNREKILTYVFGILIIKAIVFSSRSIDVSGEIARGDLSNYLLKPVSYFKYWFTRDMSSKFLNLTFAVFEIIILYFILKPPLYFPVNPLYLFLFIVSLVMAILIYYLLVFIFSTIPFWNPEQSWGALFLFMIFSDFLGGGLFPLDIFPGIWRQIIYLLPFAYILFFPLQIYLEKINLITTFSYLGIAILWVVVLYIALKFLWKKGMLAYRAEGR